MSNLPDDERRDRGEKEKEKEKSKREIWEERERKMMTDKRRDDKVAAVKDEVDAALVKVLTLSDTITHTKTHHSPFTFTHDTHTHTP